MNENLKTNMSKALRFCDMSRVVENSKQQGRQYFLRKALLYHDLPSVISFSQCWRNTPQGDSYWRTMRF